MGLDLAKQVGPMPLGAWLAVVGGGLGIAYYARKESGSGPPMRDTSGDPEVGVGGSGMWTPVGPSGDPPGPPPITTNEEWAVQAINYLIAQGYDPNMADMAIRKYIVSDRLSIQEWALVRFALAKFGSPPQVLPPGENERPPGGGGGGNNDDHAVPPKPPPATKPPPKLNPPIWPGAPKQIHVKIVALTAANQIKYQFEMNQKMSEKDLANYLLVWMGYGSGGLARKDSTITKITVTRSEGVSAAKIVTWLKINMPGKKIRANDPSPYPIGR